MLLDIISGFFSWFHLVQVSGFPYLSSDEVVEGVNVSKVSGQDESLSTSTLGGVADTKQCVATDGTHLGGRGRRNGDFQDITNTNSSISMKESQSWRRV